MLTTSWPLKIHEYSSPESGFPLIRWGQAGTSNRGTGTYTPASSAECSIHSSVGTGSSSGGVPNMCQWLSRLADDVLERARGTRIRNITHTDTITTVYEEERQAVVRTSASTNDPDRTLTPTARKPKRREVRKKL